MTQGPETRIQTPQTPALHSTEQAKPATKLIPAAKQEFLLPSDSPNPRHFALFYHNEREELFAVGNNERGQLGNGNTSSQSKPIKITHNFLHQKILRICCGYEFTTLLTDAAIYTFGCNEDGQLGDGTTTDASTPQDITQGFGGERVVLVSCGSSHTLALTDQNNVFSYGYNGYGQLGAGDIENRSKPTNILHNLGIVGPGKDRVVGVACGGM